MKTILFTLLALFFSLHSVALEEENFQDLHKFQKDMEQAVQKIQQITNPVLGKTGQSSGAAAVQMERWRVKFFNVLNDQKFIDAINKIWNHPHRNYVFYTQLGLFFFMVLFKAWRKSKASNWLWSIWVSFYCFILFWGLSVILIPLVMLGDPYQVILNSLWKIITT